MSPEVSQFLDGSASFSNGLNGLASGSSTVFSSPSVALTPDTSVFDTAFPQVADTSGVFDGIDFSHFGQASLSDMDTFAQMPDPNLGTVIPHSLAQDRKTQLLLMGWPLHLPEPEVTRHL